MSWVTQKKVLTVVESEFSVEMKIINHINIRKIEVSLISYSVFIVVL